MLITTKFLKETYLTITAAITAGLYWPWAMANPGELFPYTEGIAVWIVFGLAPVAMIEWGTAFIQALVKALASLPVSTYARWLIAPKSVQISGDER